MEKSEHLNELLTALAKAQGEIKGAAKDADNPFFKSKYADLSSIWNACRDPLTLNGLSVSQHLGNDGDLVTVTTKLGHASGQWVSSTMKLLPKDASPQAMGSAWTYGRRYALAAVAGVAPDDDDGEAAQGRQSAAPAKRPAPVPKPVVTKHDDLMAGVFEPKPTQSEPLKPTQAIYQETDDQKKFFTATAKKHGITERSSLIATSAKCRGLEMGQIDAAIREIIEGGT